MKKILALTLAAILLLTAFGTTALSEFDASGLTLDGNPASLKDVETAIGYNFTDSSGNYVPMYYESAKTLWEIGLFLGSDGSFDLDNPIRRVEGAVMALRMLGVEKEAIEQNLACPFADVDAWARPYVGYASANGIANGYSATTFGSNDAMSASQFITFVLRAMGYSDAQGDFAWNSSYEKAFELGIIGEPCRNQYARTNLFLRDNVAVICHNALMNKTKSGEKLVDTITVPGRPPTPLPTAVKSNTPPTTPTPSPTGTLSPTAPPADSDSMTFTTQSALAKFNSGNYSGDVEATFLLSCKYFNINSSEVNIFPVTAGNDYLVEYTFDYADTSQWGFTGMSYNGQWIELPVKYKMTITLSYGDSQETFSTEKTFGGLMRGVSYFSVT